MKKFEFSKQDLSTAPIFSGHVFYQVYKDSEFLRHSENIETILAKGYELRNMLKTISPGEWITVDRMILERNTPLLVKKTGPGIIVENYEFTANRLTGLVAAYAYENRRRFPVINSTEALALGLVWDNSNDEKCKLYLAAVSGTEHFYNQFTFFPLVCALRKLQLSKITLEPVMKMAKIKNSNGVRMATDFMQNTKTVQKLWSYFSGTNKFDITEMLNKVPIQLKNIFMGAV